MKISDNSMTIELPNKIENFNFFTKEPFVIFYQNNFIKPDVYNKFAIDVDNFIKENNLKDTTNSRKKLKIEGLSSFYKYHINKDSLVTNFFRLLYSNKFYEWFKTTHLIFYKEGIFGSVFPRNNFQQFLFKGINFFGKKFFSKKFFSIHSLSVEFADMEKGSCLTPHTDSSHKRMALVLYVPSPSINIDEIKEKNWGTVFWKPKQQNLKKKSWKSHHQDLNEFQKDYEVAIKVPYKANSINGFIKGDNSWHSVDRNQLLETRRAIVINIFDYSSS